MAKKAKPKRRPLTKTHEQQTLNAHLVSRLSLEQQKHRVALLDARNKFINDQQRINYQNELDRHQGMMNKRVIIPQHVLERTEHLKKLLTNK
jgi:hypothetical protein